MEGEPRQLIVAVGSKVSQEYVDLILKYCPGVIVKRVSLIDTQMSGTNPNSIIMDEIAEAKVQKRIVSTTSHSVIHAHTIGGSNVRDERDEL
jgi:hypothetical protein